MGLTLDLCTAIYENSVTQLDGECVDRVKRAIADGVAVAIAGHREPAIRLGAEHVRSLGGAPQASVWGWGFKASVVQAAWVNAMATHVLDFEPMWSPPTHSVSPTVPSVLAIAEMQGATGADIIQAVANGLETQGRLLFAAGWYEPDKLVFHPPGVVGVFGSAVASSLMLKLDTKGLQTAMGIAASRAGALLANVGTMTKCTHCGNSAASGLEAALLAQRGFTSNPDVFEAHKGVLSAYFPGGLDESRLRSYGRPFRVVDPGLAIKMFPSQFGTQYTTTAGIELHPQIADTSRITRVHIVSPVMKYVDRARPIDGLDGKFSLQYTACAAILDGKSNIDTFSDERRFRPDMVALLDKTVMVQDPNIVGDFHRMHVTITVDLEDGRQVSATCRAPNGSWGGKPLQPGEHQVKLRDCLTRALPGDSADELIGQLERLEKQDAAGVARILSIIGSAR